MRPQVKEKDQPKIDEKRRSIRMNSRVPVAIEGDGTDANRISREEAFTRVVGRYGCLVVLRQNLDLAQALRIVNLATKETNAAVIVWKGHERPDGWELGIELVEPTTDFWGLQL